MDAREICLLAELEAEHWWYRGRRALLAHALRRLGGPAPGTWALDIGAASGGNTRVLVAHGWRALATDHSPVAVTLARQRGLAAIRADARGLPVKSGAFGLVTAFDVLEHLDQDHLAAQEIARVLAPGGTALIAVPCSMALWSAHDEAVGHRRRYDRRSLAELVERSGLVIDRIDSWNVLLRPLVAWRRRRSTGSDLSRLPPLVNRCLTAIIAVERCLPVRSLPGVSLIVRATKPA